MERRRWALPAWPEPGAAGPGPLGQRVRRRRRAERVGADRRRGPAVRRLESAGAAAADAAAHFSLYILSAVIQSLSAFSTGSAGPLCLPIGLLARGKCHGAPKVFARSFRILGKKGRAFGRHLQNIVVTHGRDGRDGREQGLPEPRERVPAATPSLSGFLLLLRAPYSNLSSHPKNLER